MKIEQEIKSTKFHSNMQKATVNLIFTSNWYINRINKYLKKYKLQNEQFNVLRILRGSSPDSLCVREIGNRMLMKNSNVPRILERLEKKALVTRTKSEDDKRESITILTQKAFDILSEIDNELVDLEKNIINLTEGEAEILNSLLDKMRI